MFWSGDKLSPTTHTPSERPRRLEAATYPIQIPDRLPRIDQDAALEDTMTLPTIDQARSWRGLTLVATDDEPVGKIEAIYVDRTTRQPGWALVHTGLFGSSRTFVPLADAAQLGDTSAVMAPLIRTPRTRKGRAWMTMATNTVVQVRNATGLSEPVSVPREYRATTTSSTTRRPSTRRRGSRDVTSCAAWPGPSVDFMAGILVSRA